ncbi:MAG: hypothetical protein ACREBW_07970 [Candidatus Micrarchaeaceae archaeon]
MSNLSQALQKFYSRKGNRIVFRNDQSLNQLALAMWEKLDFQQVDASVLSRVISGERLLTPAQLRAMCELLQLPDSDVENLLVCLQRDYNAKNHLDFDVTYITPSLAKDVIEELTQSAFDMFHQGNYELLEKRFALVRQLANMYLSDTDRSLVIGESVGLHLYLRGRSLVQTSRRVLAEVEPVYAQLLAMGETYGSAKLRGYAAVLMSAAHCAVGDRAAEDAKRRHYQAFIRFAKKAMDMLPNGDHERIFAFRSLTASAYYLGDTKVIQDVSARSLDQS